jgi:hypothetical protein
MVVATTAFCDCVAFGGFHEGWKKGDSSCISFVFFTEAQRTVNQMTFSTLSYELDIFGADPIGWDHYI